MHKSLEGLVALILLIMVKQLGAVEDSLMMSSKIIAEGDVMTVPVETQVAHESEPLVRVGLFEGYDRADFRVSGNFSITTLDGESIYSSIQTSRRWRCKVDTSSPAKYVYSIVMGTFKKENNAEKLANDLRANGHPARVLPFGRDVEIGGSLVHEGRMWRVIVGAFDSEERARPYLDKLTDLDFRPTILRHKTEEPVGKIELYDAEYDRSAMLEQGFRLIPDNDSTRVTIYDIRVGVGFHWEHSEDRIYRGIVEVRIDNTGNLLALNEILLDDYLKGVVPSEMPSSFPPEALKAQAVAARSYTVAKLASIPSNEPIDFPATVLFQVYSGVTHETDETSNAVDETAGEVLRSGHRVCETYFCSNSGGHTESKEYWRSPAEPYLEGVPLVPKQKAADFEYDLTNELDVRKWLLSHPDSYSNPRGTGINALDRNAKYFRWEVTYSRRELEEIIQRKLGFDVGTLIDIQPLRRGKSGRITELEILGSHRNHKIFGELNIRRVLSENTLPSSCFLVKLVMGELDQPVEISFIGAGFGHGVGMDQTAAGVMAHSGKKYDTILRTFYKGSKKTKIW